MNLADLKKSVTEMTDGELLETLRTVRASRRTPAARTAKAKSVDPSAVMDLVESMSDAERAEIASLLEDILGEEEVEA